MPILVNGEIVPRELLLEEERRLAASHEWRVIPEALEKQTHLRQAAEACVIDRILLRQAADRDPRPIDAAVIASHVKHLSATQGCRVLVDEGPLTRQIEGQLRLQRTMRDLMGPLGEPTEDEIASLYKAQRHNFQRPEIVNAAHIVKQVDELQPEADARAGIEAALAALDRGEPFGQVSDLYSDCQGSGGNLGSFERGVMVQEFDDVVFQMKPGERSPIFRTPFGFHIAEVRSKTESNGIADLSDVRDTIKLFLTAQRDQEAARRVINQLRAQAQISQISTSDAERVVSRQGTD
jgi:PPIC-type PPIASE domain